MVPLVSGPSQGEVKKTCPFSRIDALIQCSNQSYQLAFSIWISVRMKLKCIQSNLHHRFRKTHANLTAYSQICITVINSSINFILYSDLIDGNYITVRQIAWTFLSFLLVEPGNARIVKLANFGLRAAYGGALIIGINYEMVISNWRLF